MGQIIRIVPQRSQTDETQKRTRDIQLEKHTCVLYKASSILASSFVRSTSRTSHRANVVVLCPLFSVGPLPHMESERISRPRHFWPGLFSEKGLTIFFDTKISKLIFASLSCINNLKTFLIGNRRKMEVFCSHFLSSIPVNCPLLLACYAYFLKQEGNFIQKGTKLLFRWKMWLYYIYLIIVETCRT